MIEAIPDLPEGTVGFSFTAQVSADDYQRVLEPALERVLAEHERVKALFRFGPAFEGYDLAAAWEDTRTGLRHWRGFERIAVVTDHRALRPAVQAIGMLMPCPVRLFADGAEPEARRWLGESLGTIHLEEKDGVIAVRLIGQLEPSAYEGIDQEITALFSHHAPVRLLLDLREFDGWSGLTALADHLSILREHRGVPERVAVVGQAPWQHHLQRLIARFSRAESRWFDAAHGEKAEPWLRQAGSPAS
ncbi:MAG: STAS/SEC14 domain-containing protein [Synechococcaceae cyanobacterium]|nr:STAS/SEC14 domain-containing protein [Synechococcaceae cyanobacterium]